MRKRIDPFSLFREWLQRVGFRLVVVCMKHEEEKDGARTGELTDSPCGWLAGMGRNKPDRAESETVAELHDTQAGQWDGRAALCDGRRERATSEQVSSVRPSVRLAV